jgi:hypothetical protein
MRREECIEVFQKVPEVAQAQMNLVLRNGAMLAVDVVARFEPLYLVFRGREGGTNDDGRAFFVPYEEISYLRLERVMKLGELKEMYGETGYVDAEDRLSKGEQQEQKEVIKSTLDMQTPLPTSSVGQQQDPATIAKQNLLERIRARRAGLAGATGKLTDRK